MKRKSIIILILLGCSYLLFCYFVYQQNLKVTSLKQNTNIIKEETNTYFAILQIPKINLKQKLVEPNSNENNVNQNIMILKESSMPDIDNSILFLAAHSGTGEHTYFNQLGELSYQDIIIIYYQNEKYIYQVDQIYEEAKNGYIHVSKKKDIKQIILTTCHPNKKNKQLIVSGILVHKERET